MKKIKKHAFSDRKSQERKTSKSKVLHKEYRILIDKAGVGLSIIDFNENFILVNPAAEKIFGVGKGKLCGRSLKEFFPENQVDLLEKQLKKRLKGKAGSYNIKIRREDKKERILHVVATPKMDSKNKPEFSVGIFRDITDETKSTEKIRKLSAVVEQSSSMIVITDTDGNVDYANKKTYDVSGYTEDEIIGRNARIFGTPEVNMRKDMWNNITAGKEWHGEFKNTRKDKTSYWVSASISPLKNEKGVTTHYIGVMDDITATKEIEILLIEARTAAENSTKAKSEFLANMSHEIRTPLNGIIGMTNIALETDLTRDQREYLEMIKYSSENLLSIINTILDFSKIESGKMDVREDEFSFRNELEKTARPIAIETEKKNVELVIDIDANVPDLIVSDKNMLMQIVTNLAGNSAKFTKIGEVLVKVFFDEERGHLIIRIEDTGIGIAKENTKKVFEPFVQEESATSRKYGGTGLGTTISKYFANLLGGEIEAESPSSLSKEGGRGRGSSFTVNIPLKSFSYKQRDSFEKTQTDMPVIIMESNALSASVMKKNIMEMGFEKISVKLSGALTEEEKMGNEIFIVDAGFDSGRGIELAGSVLIEKKDATVIILIPPSKLKPCLNLCETWKTEFFLVRPILQNNFIEKLRAALKRIKTKENEKEQENTVFEKARVLLAEDNMVNQKLVMILLTKAGIDVDVAVNGEDAVKMIKNREYRLILMDVQMPVKDGIDATNEIRTHEKEKNIKRTPIIAMTANALRGERERLLRLGMDDYISKPFNKEEFFEVLKKYLKIK